MDAIDGSTNVLKNELNSCKPPQYTKIGDLRSGFCYPIVKFEPVTGKYGETVSATLEGLVGDDFFLRVYLPKRFLKVLTPPMIEQYNAGEIERLALRQYNNTIEFV